jgi:hypothetical protein
MSVQKHMTSQPKNSSSVPRPSLGGSGRSVRPSVRPSVCRPAVGQQCDNVCFSSTDVGRSVVGWLDDSVIVSD